MYTSYERNSFCSAQTTPVYLQQRGALYRFGKAEENHLILFQL